MAASLVAAGSGGSTGGGTGEHAAPMTATASRRVWSGLVSTDTSYAAWTSDATKEGGLKSGEVVEHALHVVVLFQRVDHLENLGCLVLGQLARGLRDVLGLL